MSSLENIPDSFYLGKKYDLENKQLLDEVLQYRSRDLTTHALCVGMTGSGKTGLCTSLIEEAALDGIPVICVDPKGDLGNLLLAFPDLEPSDFEPWIDRASNPDTAAAASKFAEVWKKGLSSWGYDRTQLEQMKSVEKIIYTPGSTAGIPLTVLRSLDAPGDAIKNDAELLRDQVSSSVSGLLALLGITADPLSSREHILLSNILAASWESGNDLSMEELIRQIQSPPMSKIGVMSLEQFFPTADRAKLAMTLNNLLASPSFAGWLQGEAMSIDRLLFDDQGKAKISIISVSHLSDTERMFFVTILLNELVAWMRMQRGTSALRAIFYMDEIFGYFPPSSKPPSKGPMMTLLKQARAFGLGVVLATQNPADIDYKGLSNMGTWFLGRLQTQRDKDRVLEGLEGASLQQGSAFDRAKMDRALSGLGNRVFLMNNVHMDAPTIFQTRFALSFLRGPLARDEISRLMAPIRERLQTKRAGSAANSGAPTIAVQPKREEASPAVPEPKVAPGGARPILPPGIEERFVEPIRPLRSVGNVQWRASLMGHVSVHFVKSSNAIDVWKDQMLIAYAEPVAFDHVWENASTLQPESVSCSKSPESTYAFDQLPDSFLNAKNFKAWEKELVEYLFRHEKLKLYACPSLKQCSLPDVEEFEARLQLSEAAREARDAAMDKVRGKYDEKLRVFEAKVMAAQSKLDRAIEDAKAKRLDGLVDIGTSILGALLGGRRKSVSSSTVRDLTRSSASTDISRAQDSLDDLVMQKNALERECRDELDAIESQFSIENLKLEEVEVPIRKADTKVKLLAIAWIPWLTDSSGRSVPLVPANT